MAANKIYPFCPTDTGTNLESDATYFADTGRSDGNQPGEARSKLINKSLRGPSLVAAAIAQIAADYQATDVVDSLSVAALSSMLLEGIINALETPQALAIAAGHTAVVMNAYKRNQYLLVNAVTIMDFPSALKVGMTWNIIFEQDGSGHAVTWAAGWDVRGSGSVSGSAGIFSLASCECVAVGGSAKVIVCVA